MKTPQKDSLGDRIKHNYEDRYRISLTRRAPVIIRLDGKAFHTLTRGAEKPFDAVLASAMYSAASKLIKEVQGAKCAYVQSDEISILVTDFDKLTTDAWFDYNLQKMTSVSASIASVEFTRSYGKTGYFDSRAFNIPKDEVINYFRWRYLDWRRNSIQMLAQSLYSQTELHRKNQAELHEMCFQKGQNWNDLCNTWKNGAFLPFGQVPFSNFNLMADDDVTNEYINSVLYPGEVHESPF